jgi:hypothetical protein
MDCTEAKGMIGAGAMGALEPGERARLEEHVRGCPACAGRLAELEDVVELVDLAGPPAPAALPDGFEERLIAHGAAQAPAAAVRRRRLPTLRSTRLVLAGAAAGIAATLAVTAALGYLGGSSSTPVASWTVDMIATPRAPTAKAVAYVIEQPRGTTIALQAQGLPALRPGDRCVVWVAGKRESYSAGTIQITRGWATAILRGLRRPTPGATIRVLIVPAHGGAPKPLLWGRVV